MTVHSTNIVHVKAAIVRIGELQNAFTRVAAILHMRPTLVAVEEHLTSGGFFKEQAADSECQVTAQPIIHPALFYSYA